MQKKPETSPAKNQETKNMVQSKPALQHLYFFPEFKNDDGSTGISIEAVSLEQAKDLFKKLVEEKQIDE